MTIQVVGYTEPCLLTGHIPRTVCVVQSKTKRGRCMCHTLIYIYQQWWWRWWRWWWWWWRWCHRELAMLVEVILEISLTKITQKLNNEKRHYLNKILSIHSYYHEEIINIHVWFFFQLWYLILLIYYYYYMDLLLLWTGSRSYIQVNTNIWVREDVNNNNIIISSIPFGIDSYLYHSLLDWFRSPYRRNLFFVFACYV